ncbi:MAG: hypothetical protein HOE48_10330 [Candidatus Latescibacteria bacterium]|nr:hypothetical protein [Candidatus Latescibacterota bacterium]
MKRSLCVCVMLLALVACGSDSSTGSTTFVAEELTIEGNPSIVGEGAGTAAAPSGFISIGGLVDSRLGLELTNLSVQLRVLAADGSLLGSGTVACSPATVAPGGSSTFQTNVSLPEASYTSSSSIEVTPVCDQGTGTVRSVSLLWN